LVKHKGKTKTLTPPSFLQKKIACAGYQDRRLKEKNIAENYKVELKKAHGDNSST